MPKPELKSPLVLLIILVVLSLACGFLAAPDQPAAQAQATDAFDETYLGLRSRLLALDPGEVGLEPSAETPNVWAVLMEFRLSDGGAVTLVAVADGSTSLYFSNGGGILGTGEKEAVARASQALVALAEDHYNRMAPTEDFPLPVRDKIQFYVLTYAGAYTANLDEEGLGAGEHEFSPLFYAANEVITQVRLNSPDN